MDKDLIIKQAIERKGLSNLKLNEIKSDLIEDIVKEVIEITIKKNIIPDDLKNVKCPQCKKDFVLMWNDYSDTPETLNMRGCPSGGIYDVSINCPHCDYSEDL